MSGLLISVICILHGRYSSKFYAVLVASKDTVMIRAMSNLIFLPLMQHVMQVTMAMTANRNATVQVDVTMSMALVQDLARHHGSPGILRVRQVLNNQFYCFIQNRESGVDGVICF